MGTAKFIFFSENPCSPVEGRHVLKSVMLGNVPKPWLLLMPGLASDVDSELGSDAAGVNFDLVFTDGITEQ